VNEDLLPPGSVALTTVPRGALVNSVAGREVSDWAELQRAIMTARPGSVTITFDNAPPVAVRVPGVDSLRANLMNALEPDVSVEPVLGGIIKDGPADQAGLEPGDRVLEAGGAPIRDWQDFVAVVERNPGRPLPLTVERSGARVSLLVTPEPRTAADDLRFGRIGVSAYFANEDVLPRQHLGPLRAIGRGATQTWDMVTLTVDFLAGMITGRQSARNVGGPIMIGQMSGKFARAGLEAFLGFMALLSVNLAVLNLLPIPVLDGGHLVFLGIEAVRGRPLSVEQRMRLAQIGFIFLVAIMVWAIGNDLMRAFGI
jgi:regulator of sigma E protease